MTITPTMRRYSGFFPILTFPQIFRILMRENGIEEESRITYLASRIKRPTSSIKKIMPELSPIEIIAALATVVNVYLASKNKISCWYWGIASVTLYGYVFYDSKLYSSMGLQVLYYLPMQFYGLWSWRRNRFKEPSTSDNTTRENELPITKLSLGKRLGWLGINIPLAGVLGYAMSHTGAELTYVDAFATALSVIAQYLLTHRIIENWVMWIAIDVVYAGYLLPVQGLYVSTGLYVILLIISSTGLWQWSRIMHSTRSFSTNSKV